MSRQKKEAKPFSCQMDVAVFDKMEAYCRMTGLSKTVVVEQALSKYIEEKTALMKKMMEVG